jgi:hypothetical protein
MLWVFKNRILRKILGCKKDGPTGQCGKEHNEELQDL